MRNVDCEWLVNESHNCCHPERCKGLIAKLWTITCIEYKIDDVDCRRKESLWDMLKKQNPQNNAGTNGNPNRPPPPPAPPPKRVYSMDDDIPLQG